MTVYKQHCIKLLQILDTNWPLGLPTTWAKWADAVRAALAKPEPEGPTDEELMNLLPLYSYEDGLYDGFFQPGSLPSDWGDEDDYIASPRAILVFARAVLARWGNHPGSPDSSKPQPISVTERLPRPEDCDAEGRCWLCGKVEGDWRLLDPNNSGVPRLKYCFSHWLPAHALPLPS